MARTAAQRAYVTLLTAKPTRIVIATGPAGTGKTRLAVAEGVQAISTGQVQRLVFARPTVSAAGENLGFLPGSAEDKMSPFVQPMMDALGCFLTAREIRDMRIDGRIELAPLAFMRGRTFHKTWVVLDEAQNTTPAQMCMALTRAGADTKIVVTGDLDQSDIGGVNGLADLLARLPLATSHHGAALIEHVALGTEDVQRSEAVKEVLRLYKGGVRLSQ
jgi:phosphate starvation-inducible protein PhoH and related proteins